MHGIFVTRKTNTVWVAMQVGNLVSRKHIFFEFQSSHGNLVKRNNDWFCFYEGMEILTTGTTIVWVLMKAWKSYQYCFGFSHGMEIMSRGTHQICLSSNEGMEILSPVNKIVWVAMKAWNSCQQETITV